MLYRLFYRARANYPPFTFHDLDIMREAIAFNGENDITGLLIRDQYEYYQILEGERDIICPLVQRIARDGRIYDYMEIWSSHIDARLFGYWAMGFHMLGPQDSGLPHRLSQLLPGAHISLKQQAIRDLGQLALEKETQDKRKRAAIGSP